MPAPVFHPNGLVGWLAKNLTAVQIFYEVSGDGLIFRAPLLLCCSETPESATPALRLMCSASDTTGQPVLLNTRRWRDGKGCRLCIFKSKEAGKTCLIYKMFPFFQHCSKILLVYVVRRWCMAEKFHCISSEFFSPHFSSSAFSDHFACVWLFAALRW